MMFADSTITLTAADVVIVAAIAIIVVFIARWFR